MKTSTADSIAIKSDGEREGRGRRQETKHTKRQLLKHPFHSNKGQETTFFFLSRINRNFPQHNLLKIVSKAREPLDIVQKYLTLTNL